MIIRFKKGVIIKLCFIVFLCYYIKTGIFTGIKHIHKGIPVESRVQYNNTSVCKIPNYIENMEYLEAEYEDSTCGQRAVHIDLVSESEIIFRKDLNAFKKLGYTNFSCGFKEIRDLKRDTIGILASIKPFEDGQVEQIRNDTSIFVVCCKIPVTQLKYAQELSPPVYTDFYVIIKKHERSWDENEGQRWNVLVLGMESMSRGRMYHSMPRLVRYFKNEEWLDYSVFHKVSEDSNILALLTGNKTLNKECYNLHLCKEKFLIHKYRNDYITALGEDLTVPQGSVTAKMAAFYLTDHYLSILSSIKKGNLQCYGQISTGEQFLNYAHQFVQIYKYQNFFGLFWSSTFSRFGNNGIPALFEDPLIKFFNSLSNEGVFENTFILFLGDESLNYGPTTHSINGYYDSRLPAFFLWVPHKFRKSHKEKYKNLITNQDRLTTYYDVNMFVDVIMNASDKNVDDKTSKCVACLSLLEPISTSRTCENANIETSLCTCQNMLEIDKNESIKQGLFLALSEITKMLSEARFIKPAKCKSLSFSRVLRNHFYKSNHETYYITVGELNAGDVVFESVVKKSDDVYRLISLRSLIDLDSKSDCVFKNDTGKEFCICENDYQKSIRTIL